MENGSVKLQVYFKTQRCPNQVALPSTLYSFYRSRKNKMRESKKEVVCEEGSPEPSGLRNIRVTEKEISASTQEASCIGCRVHISDKLVLKRALIIRVYIAGPFFVLINIIFLKVGMVPRKSTASPSNVKKRPGSNSRHRIPAKVR